MPQSSKDEEAWRRRNNYDQGASLGHAWLPRPGHMSPLGHKREQLAGDGVVGVGRYFGLFLG
jgi:hypothetical protein